MNELKLKGIWIPREILILQKLSDKEKIVLSIILALSSELKYCFVSNLYLSKILGITKNRVSKIISSLNEKGYVEVKINLDDRKQVKSRELKLTEKLLKGMVTNDNTYSYLGQHPIVRNNNYIINKYKKYYNNRYIPSFEQRNYTKEELEKLYMNTDT